MKIERQAEKFTPITITIESKEELHYLYALSNSTIRQVKDNAIPLSGIDIDDTGEIQMSLFRPLDSIVKSS